MLGMVMKGGEGRVETILRIYMFEWIFGKGVKGVKGVKGEKVWVVSRFGEVAG